jgi:hypothetical protein
MAATTNPLPVQGGTVIGEPYQGTHAKAFNQSGGSDNWESENAVDIAVPVGTPIYATQSGTIGPQFGSLGEGGRFAGLRLHLNGATWSAYYAHLSRFAAGIRPGVTVQAGELLGYSGSANGVAHLHYATTTNIDPLAWIKGLPAAVADAATGAGGGADSSSSAGDTVALKAAGCATLLVRGVLYLGALGPVVVLSLRWWL